VVNATPWPLYPRERDPSTHRTGGWVGRSWRVRKISPPTGIRSPDRSGRSQSVYRLRYPSPQRTLESINCGKCTEQLRELGLCLCGQLVHLLGLQSTKVCQIYHQFLHRRRKVRPLAYFVSVSYQFWLPLERGLILKSRRCNCSVPAALTPPHISVWHSVLPWHTNELYWTTTNSWCYEIPTHAIQTTSIAHDMQQADK
jgi:hypothetical protein